MGVEPLLSGVVWLLSSVVLVDFKLLLKNRKGRTAWFLKIKNFGEGRKMAQNSTSSRAFGFWSMPQQLAQQKRTDLSLSCQFCGNVENSQDLMKIHQLWKHPLEYVKVVRSPESRPGKRAQRT